MNNRVFFIRRVFAAFVTKGLSATLLLLSNIFVARNFEIGESAVFFIVLNILIGATIFINMGLNTTLMRVISSASYLPESVAAAFFAQGTRTLGVSAPQSQKSKRRSEPK